MHASFARRPSKLIATEIIAQPNDVALCTDLPSIMTVISCPVSGNPGREEI